MAQFALGHGDAEIGQDRPALLVQQDVGRFDVPVDEPLVVGVVQVPGDLGDDPGGLLPAGAGSRPLVLSVTELLFSQLSPH